MHQNHFPSWFKLFGVWSIRNFGRKARNGISKRETGSNGNELAFRAPNSLNQLEIWV
jgi:hypothetical protein